MVKLITHCTPLVISILFLLVITNYKAHATSGLLTIQVQAANPTYLQFCVQSVQTIIQAEIKTYNWDVDTEDPKRQWFPMIQASFDPKCWYYPAGESESLIYVPASIRLTAQASGKQLTLTNILTALSPAPFTLYAPDFDSPDPYVPPADIPLKYALTPSGNVSAYTAATTHFDSVTYACMFQPVAPYNDMFAAIRVQDWQTSQVCGQCLRLCNSTGHSVEVMVVDQCPFPNVCTRYHWLDISPKAFGLLSNGHTDWGVQQLTWRFVECSGVAMKNVSYMLEDWSRNYGFALQVRNYRLGLKQVSIQSISGNPSQWIPLTRSDSNYFFHSTGTTIQCPCRLKLVSIADETLIDERAFLDDIGYLPKNPNILKGNVQFTTIPIEYQQLNGQCVPFWYNQTQTSSSSVVVNSVDQSV